MIFTESLQPAEHGSEGWVVFRIQVIRLYNTVQHSGDHFCFVVLIWHKTIRKLIMIGVAVLTMKPSDD